MAATCLSTYFLLQSQFFPHSTYHGWWCRHSGVGFKPLTSQSILSSLSITTSSNTHCISFFTYLPHDYLAMSSGRQALSNCCCFRTTWPYPIKDGVSILCQWRFLLPFWTPYGWFAALWQKGWVAGPAARQNCCHSRHLPVTYCQRFGVRTWFMHFILCNMLYSHSRRQNIWVKELLLLYLMYTC